MPYTDRYLETEPSRADVDAREGVLAEATRLALKALGHD